MVLLLVTHTIEVPSSRVPLSAIILVDAIKRKQLPPNLKCRLVIPSSGHHSCSIWDASSVEELQAWIDINLLDGTASIAEIPEEFTYGLSLELTTARAADKVATTSKSTLERINTTGARVMESMSEKLEQLDARTNLITATRETASAAAAKVKQATNSAMENESVQRGLQSLSTSLQSAGTSMNRAFTWVGSKVKESFGAEAGAGYTGGGGVGGAQSYSGFSSEPPSYEAAAYASAPAAAAGLGGSGFMPVSTHAARSSVDHQQQQQQQHRVAGPGPVTEDAGPMPQFTLDEGVASPMVLSPAKEAAEGHAAGHSNNEHDDAAAGGGEGGGLDAAPIVAPVGAAAT
ncbi:hypothetical protein CHLRE_17g706950v5 [Chlamydomonas reinhardtii]|uniref:Uncharacterized protein n=1 Tax=Chlamydomonas reinhardtii TaxID=3055 RepID=A8IRB3_CHLRE|nr:uncharacterized protein CHLRE_17g706950v5 [Chlamydomonas reinhardtii]PNW70129.1 hypothetical protein CHLRE_17g706950v5 [Chlamydomonas reinhardtii]|eukprot:XP_001691707.1 predicted protein [Chlamydomonas reinhardtii]